MLIVLDTNILLSSISKISANRWIFDAVLSGKLHLVVSNEIISEYEEIIGQKTNSLVAENVVKAILNLPFTKLVTVHFNWNLIELDVDDNKFVDAAIAGGANFLISNDNHFNVLRNIDFPAVNFMTLSEFKTEFEKSVF